MDYKKVISSVFYEFGCEFVALEPTEAKSLIPEWLKFHHDLTEAEATEVIEIVKAIAEGVIFRLNEYGVEQEFGVFTQLLND